MAKSRHLLLYVTAAMLLLVLTGQAIAAKTITVAVQAGAPEPAVYKELSKKFTEQTGIQIEWIELPQEEQRNKLVIELMSGSGAFDVIALDHPWVAEFAAAGFIEPLDYLIADERDDFLPSPLAAMSYDGKLYAIPHYAVAVIMYYRTDLFEQYGLRQPTVEQPLTWDELLEAARVLTLDEDADGRPDIYGTFVMGKRHPVTVSGFMDALHQSGGSVFAEDGSVIVHSPNGIASLQRLVDLVHKHKVAPPGAASFDHVDNHTMFLQGQIGVTMNWQYAYSMFKDPSQSKVVGKFAIAPCPQNVVSTGQAGAWGLAIPTSARNKQEAEQWIKFITSPEEMYNLRLGSFGPAVRYSELELLAGSGELDPQTLQDLQTMTRAVEVGYVIPKIPEWPQIEAILAEAVSAAISQTKTAEQALSDAAREIQSIMQ